MSAADGGQRLCLQVEGVHCAGCIQKIESALRAVPGVKEARLNFTTRRLVIGWQGVAAQADSLVEIVKGLGYEVRPYDTKKISREEEERTRHLLLALGVAGFAAGNIMMISFALWTTDAATMGVAMRDFLHWLSALIAIPAIAFAGLPFFSSAYRALRGGRTNMDVPISVGLILTTGMSLFELATHGEHAYFDSAVMLMFFLLVGRYLDVRARASARRAARDLLAVMTGTAAVITPNGVQTILIREIRPDMVLLAGMGERIAADGKVTAGESDIDISLITGETVPVTVKPGDDVLSGGLNLSAPLQIRVLRTPEDSQIGGMVRLMEKAEQSQARYVRLSDRVARLYTPVVHALALLAFAGWVTVGHLPWQEALLIAATVLIITCPCALALAVPVVQVLAVGTLMRRGVMVRSGDVLERLAQVDTVFFDKTGTLTRGEPSLVNAHEIPSPIFAAAAAMAAHSRHPLSRALSKAWHGPVPKIENVKEVPGKGLTAAIGGVEYRMGRQDWVTQEPLPQAHNTLQIVFAAQGGQPHTFLFHDEMRDDAPSVVAALQARGITVHLLSGDRSAIVAATARAAGIHDFCGDMSPANKYAALEEMQNSGRHVLMVGDGINDAPVLAGAYVSMSPSSAADIASNAAGAVFTGARLEPVIRIIDMARLTQTLVRENLAMTVVYNIFAIPLAAAGYVTPLIAAIAMSASSLAVTLNAFRLRRYV